MMKMDAMKMIEGAMETHRKFMMVDIMKTVFESIDKTNEKEVQEFRNFYKLFAKAAEDLKIINEKDLHQELLKFNPFNK
jgi:hypothetical protein